MILYVDSAFNDIWSAISDSDGILQWNGNPITAPFAPRSYHAAVVLPPLTSATTSTLCVIGGRADTQFYNDMYVQRKKKAQRFARDAAYLVYHTVSAECTSSTIGHVLMYGLFLCVHMYVMCCCL